ncbi:hypothetical protein ACRAWD_03115 [Caulobacter segnis]
MSIWSSASTSTNCCANASWPPWSSTACPSRRPALGRGAGDGRAPQALHPARRRDPAGRPGGRL